MAYNGTIKEVMLGENELYEIEDAYARSQAAEAKLQDNLHHLEVSEKLRHEWFVISDSYGDSTYTDSPFTTQLINKGLIVGAFVQSGMGYANAWFPIANYKSQILSAMNTHKATITDIFMEIGYNDSWSYGDVGSALRSIVEWLYSQCPKLKMVHLAPLANNAEEDTMNDRIPTLHTVIKDIEWQCRSISNAYPVCFVEGSQYTMAWSGMLKEDLNHPNDHGSNWITSCVASYIRNGNWPKYSRESSGTSNGISYKMRIDGGVTQLEFEASGKSFTNHVNDATFVIAVDYMPIRPMRKFFASGNGTLQTTFSSAQIYGSIGYSIAGGNGKDEHYDESGVYIIGYYNDRQLGEFIPEKINMARCITQSIL